MRWLERLPVLLAILVVAAAVAFVAVNVLGGSSLPDGPADVVWDREVCAQCGMHVGDPSYAAQVQTTDGLVRNFDDPGCAFQLLASQVPSVHAIYFHHHRDDRWLAADDTAFIAVASSPMGFGFAAVDAGTPGAIGLAEARERMTRKQ